MLAHPAPLARTVSSRVIPTLYVIPTTLRMRTEIMITDLFFSESDQY